MAKDRTTPLPGVAAAIAHREAERERELAGLRKICAGQKDRIIEQQKQISDLRRQIARAHSRAQHIEAAE